jgi:hypothetical protein
MLPCDRRLRFLLTLPELPEETHCVAEHFWSTEEHNLPTTRHGAEALVTNALLGALNANGAKSLTSVQFAPSFVVNFPAIHGDRQGRLDTLCCAELTLRCRDCRGYHRRSRTARANND